MAQRERIAVFGLGYVGLPLAVALAKNYRVTGIDIDAGRIGELTRGNDRTGEVSPDALHDADLALSEDNNAASGADIFIVAVPTPVDSDNRPDLRALGAASKDVGSVIAAGALVVYESTVYPGVTEDFCAPILEAESGLKAGRDFFLGYSPERMNPGDGAHSLQRITKIVSAQTTESAERLRQVYGSVNDGNIFVAQSIRVAEAAKVIENAQRDINIAFVNEISGIFSAMGLSVYDVLDAANTKWNFLPFEPGLVGGHCIGVDPYYLAHAAKAHGIEPDVILAGRAINDCMGARLAETISNLLARSSIILVLGLSFKENIPDVRNSKVVDLVVGLASHGHAVQVYDPVADPVEAARFDDIDLVDAPDGSYDCIVGAVRHRAFEDLDVALHLAADGLLADLKAIWRLNRPAPAHRYWSL